MENKIYFIPDHKPEKAPKKVQKGLNRTSIKQKPRKISGELEFMKEQFLLKAGLCEITGEELEFSPMVCHHILPKKTYGRWRLEPKNLIIIQEDIHFLYHNASKEYALSLYPGMSIIYEKHEELKTEYYTKPPTT